MVEELFYDKGIAVGLYTLGKEESSHIARVLRKQKGDTLHFTNGKGMLFSTKIIEASPKACILEVYQPSVQLQERDFWLGMAVSPTKNISRFEWFLEKAVELGVDMVIPLITEHSERRTINTERLEKVAVAAMKQSFKFNLPEITQAMGITEALKTLEGTTPMLAHLGGNNISHLADAMGESRRLSIFIGPEGDFSEKEIKQVIAAGAQQVHLGPSRLRTETAALSACLTVHIMRRQ